jgi:hypothetical protein
LGGGAEGVAPAPGAFLALLAGVPAGGVVILLVRPAALVVAPRVAGVGVPVVAAVEPIPLLAHAVGLAVVAVVAGVGGEGGSLLVAQQVTNGGADGVADGVAHQAGDGALQALAQRLEVVVEAGEALRQRARRVGPSDKGGHVRLLWLSG